MSTESSTVTVTGVSIMVGAHSTSCKCSPVAASGTMTSSHVTNSPSAALGWSAAD